MRMMRRVTVCALLALVVCGTSPTAAQLLKTGVSDVQRAASAAGAAAANVVQNGLGANLPQGGVAANLLQGGVVNAVQGATTNIAQGAANAAANAAGALLQGGADVSNVLSAAAGKLLGGVPGDIFKALSGPSAIQQAIQDTLPQPFGDNNQTLFMNILSQPTPLGFAAAGSSDTVKSGLTNLLNPTTIQTRSDPAAGGVVAASLLLASGICVTVGGGLGTAYAAAGAALGLINQEAARINLGLEYAKAGLGLAEDASKTRQEYMAMLIKSGALPNILQRSAQVRSTLASTVVPQLQSLQGRMNSVRDKLTAIGNIASAASGGLVG